MTSELSSPPSSIENLSVPAGPTKTVIRLLKSNAIGVVALLLVIAVTLGNPAFLSFFNIANMLSQWAPRGTHGDRHDLRDHRRWLRPFSRCRVLFLRGGRRCRCSGPLRGDRVHRRDGGRRHCGSRQRHSHRRFGINPFITPVGTGFIVTGLTFVLTSNAAFMVADPSFDVLGAGRFHGVPYSGLLLIAGLIVAAFALSRTIYGHVLYAVGGNPEASRVGAARAADRRKHVRSARRAHRRCRLHLGVPAEFGASEHGSQHPVRRADHRDRGGTPLGGGVGSIGKTAVGLIIIATITNGFVLLDISPLYQNIIKGVLIVGALVFDSLLKRTGRSA